VPVFQRSCCFVRSNWSGIFMKHSSVSGSSAGHRRYWYLRHRHAALFRVVATAAGRLQLCGAADV
jgi:hypothetical protein